MLVLSRRLHEKLLFPSIPAMVQVVALKPGAVRLGIEAPPDVPVLRAELQDPRRVPRGGVARLSCTQALRQQVQAALDQLLYLRVQFGPGFRPDAAQTLDELDQELRDLQRQLEAVPGPLATLSSRQAGRARRALLVEDNANERELLAHCLRSAGLDVATAGDGCDALEHLRSRGRPDVLLLDMGLPRCDGPTTVHAIRRDPAYAGLKIFAVTGHTPEEFDLGTGPGGVDAWFCKPVDPIDLVRQVNQAGLSRD